MDQVTRVNKTPKVGETVMGNGLFLNPGGKGANQAVAMGKLGADVAMVGLVGGDASGVDLKANLKAMKVVDHVGVIKNAPTGTAFIMVNADADNSIVVIEGANGKFTPELVQDGWFNGIDVVVAQLEIPYDTVKTAFQSAKEKGIMTVLNPAPAKTLDKALLSVTDLLVVNETEFEVVTGKPYGNLDDMKWAYEALGVKAILLTLGKKGAYYFAGEQILHTPAKNVNAMDTTAAGDSYIGGFVSAYAKGATIESAMEFATWVAAYTVTNIGAQSALPTYDELKQFIKEVEKND